mmetsp:Transcript_13259/g.26147  ORF Transcript_13259/g.26147 Transcript_13259/m.26147 type:complete len:216 (-) Transcript_13259:592-1239(-)
MATRTWTGQPTRIMGPCPDAPKPHCKLLTLERVINKQCLQHLFLHFLLTEKRDETLVPELIDWMAAVSNRAHDTTLTFCCTAIHAPELTSCPSLLMGMVSDTMTVLREEFPMRSNAGPLKRACVQQAETLRAPISRSESADLHRVSAVSIISSTMMQCFPLISPTMFIASTSPAARRCLIVIASDMFGTFIAARLSINNLALATPPASGDTTATG